MEYYTSQTHGLAVATNAAVAMRNEQVQRIFNMNKELKRRSPARWHIARTFAANNLMDLNAIEEYLCNVLRDLDEVDEQRMYAEMRMG